MKSIYKYSILIIVSLYFIIPLFDSNEPETRDIKLVCGNYPENYVYIDIGSNPNFVFQPDSDFSPVKLWDIEGNSVFVNSFRECEHYFDGGWNYLPLIEVEEIVNDLQCDSYLKQQIEKDYILDLIEIDREDFFNNLDCIGALKQIRFDDAGIKILEVYNSNFYNFIFSQVILLALVLIIKRVRKSYYLLILIYVLSMSFYFNYLLDLNILNFVFFSNTLILIFYLLENRDSKL